MPDPHSIAICVRYSKWCQRSLWYQLASSKCEFHY